MMNWKKRMPLLLLAACLLLINACKDDDMGGSGDPCSSDFDKQALFQNIADNLIIPAYDRLKTAVDLMTEKTDLFLNNPGKDQLLEARTAFVEAYTTWQSAAQFEFGPAADVFLRSSVNNFPLNLDELNANVQSGNYDLNMPDAFDKGFPALDYLLFGVAADEDAIVVAYTDGMGADAEQLRNYFKAVTADIQERVGQAQAAWAGDYKATFVASEGTAAGSSLSLIVNSLNENYELIKREKLGVPSGVLTLGFTNPDKVEGFYSGISVALAKAALQATRDFYTGKSGTGLDDFLQTINAQKDGQALNTLINDQFAAAAQALNALSDPLPAQLDSDTDAVVNAYNEVTRQLVNIKTDMPSVLCVSITYIDNPSDSD